MVHDFLFFCSPNPLQFILVPDIKVEKNGDDDNKDDLQEEEDVDENAKMNDYLIHQDFFTVIAASGTTDFPKL